LDDSSRRTGRGPRKAAPGAFRVIGVRSGLHLGWARKMSDKSILEHIAALVEEEHRLRADA
jgi:hypothetical protein